MAGYICSVDNKNGVGEFERLVMPGQWERLVDTDIESNLAKIALLYCLPNNRGTLVYERTVPYSGLPGDIHDGFRLLSSQRNPRRFDAAVTYLNPHIVALDPSSSRGFTVEHSPFIHDDYKPLPSHKIDTKRWHNQYILPRVNKCEPTGGLN
jgi:hypothetical protein